MKLAKQTLFSPYTILAILLSLWTLTAFAQTPTGQITGRITDASGAVIPGAHVTVTNVATGVKREMPSNEVGMYVITFLLPGTYRVDVQREGFRSFTQEGVFLTVDQVVRVDVAMQVGSVTQKLEVTAAAPLLTTDSGSVGTLVSPRQVEALPLQGRNPYALSELVPGVRFDTGWQNLPIDMNVTQQIMVNGLPYYYNLFMIDGVNNNLARSDGPSMFPSPDSIQEFKLETNSLAAEFGRTAGAVFNVITKSGTDQYHGTAWEYNRIRALDSGDFFANRAGSPKPPLTFNQFGSSFGGPIRKDKTFVFGSWELARQHAGVVLLQQVPTAAQRSGDFSSTYNSKGQLVTIYDPSTTASNGSGGYVRTAFSGNKIPTNRQDKVAQNLQQFVPQPNTAGAAYTGANNFISEASTITDDDKFMIKVDQHFSDKHQLSGAFLYQKSPWIRSNWYGNDATPSYGPQVFAHRGVIVEDNYIINPSTVLSFRYGLIRSLNYRYPYSFGTSTTSLGFPASYASGLQFQSLPNMTIGGFTATQSVANIGNSGLLGDSYEILFANDTHSLYESLTMIRGKHNYKTGFEGGLMRVNTHQVGAMQNYTAAVNYTQGPNPLAATATAGSGYATYLLGAVGGTINLVNYPAAQDIYYAGYFQDAYRVLPRLTVSYGIRYDFQVPRTDRHNELTNFNWNGAVPLNAPGLNLHGVLEFPGTGGLSRAASIADWQGFAPRLGFSYDLGHHTVLRAGGGIFHPIKFVNADFGGGISGFQSTSTMVTSIDGMTPINYLSNPFPQGFAQPTGSALGAATLLGQAVGFTDRHLPNPYTFEWNFDLQHQFPGNILLDVGYVGDRSAKIEMDYAGRQFDQLPDADLALGSQLLTKVANPFYGQISSGTLAQPTVTEEQLLLPYPQFTSVVGENMIWGSSEYNALQVKAERRFSQGLSLIGTFSYSKLMDNVPASFGGEAMGGTGYQDYNNLRAEWSVGSMDQTFVSVIGYIYQLPFGRGQQFLSGINSLADRFVGGWHIQGVTTFASGSPLGITNLTNNTNSNNTGGVQRANWTGKITTLRNVNEWFDTSQFSAAPAFTFGNAPRTMSYCRADGMKNFDFTMAKNIKVTESKQLEFRAEFFNFFNTPLFGVPTQTVGSATFGAISNVLNTPRLVQLGLRLTF